MGTLYYGDNLDILRRYLKDETVDLVYLDPPFNSAQNYNAFFHEKDGTDADWYRVRPAPGHFIISASRLPVFAVNSLSAPAGSRVPNADTAGAVGIWQVARRAGAAFGRFPAATLVCFSVAAVLRRPPAQAGKRPVPALLQKPPRGPVWAVLSDQTHWRRVSEVRQVQKRDPGVQCRPMDYLPGGVCFS